MTVTVYGRRLPARDPDRLFGGRPAALVADSPSAV